MFERSELRVYFGALQSLFDKASFTFMREQSMVLIETVVPLD